MTCEWQQTQTQFLPKRTIHAQIICTTKTSCATSSHPRGPMHSQATSPNNTQYTPPPHVRAKPWPNPMMQNTRHEKCNHWTTDSNNHNQFQFESVSVPDQADGTDLRRSIKFDYSDTQMLPFFQAVGENGKSVL